MPEIASHRIPTQLATAPVGKGVAANMVKHVCAEKSDHLSLEELSRADTDASRD
jgi:hypothetical protein